jgi:hypothetical protein
MKNVLLLLFVIAACWKLFGGDGVVELEPGVLVSDDPKQTAILSAEPFDFKSYHITPLASFVIKAKVLSKNNYLLGRESDLSPIDLALGWKKMSDEAVLNKIVITQSGRWYHWQVDDFPIPRIEIETQSANMHLIPASNAVESMIKKVKQGQIIDMRGYLVRVDAKDGWHWLSSLTRNDTGAHACELVFVESFNVSVGE